MGFSTGSGGGGGVSGPLGNDSAVIDPTVDDDIDLGYTVGSHWSNVVLNKTFVCIDNTDGAAIWNQVDAVVVTILNNFLATIDPTVDDDIDLGYVIGSHWVNVTLDKTFVCVDNADGAAVWNSVDTSGETVTFSLSDAVYDNVSLSVSSEDGAPAGMVFNGDGTKVFIVGFIGDAIYQYSLPTPYILTGGTYDSVSLSVSSEEGVVTDVAFNNDGTKIFIIGSSSDAIHQYSLPTPYILTGGTYDSVSLSVSSEEVDPTGMTFSGDGNKVYITGDSGLVYQYSLPTPYILTGGTYDSVSLSVSSEDTLPSGVVFNNTGEKIYIAGSNTGVIYQYSLSTPYILTGGSYDNVSLDVSSEDSNPRGITFNDDETKIFMISYVSDNIYQYSILPEVDTGKIWSPDGKIIYKRTITVADTGVGGAETIALGATIDTLVAIGGYVIRNSDSARLPLPYSDIAANLNVEVRINSAGTDVIITSGSSQNHNGGFVWIEYTK